MFKRQKPPKLAEWLLKGMFPDDGRFTTVGDLEEVYQDLVKEKGFLRAQIWYWSQVLRSIIPVMKDFISWRLAMLKNYLKMTARNFIKHKTFTFINIVGLAIGMTCCIVIFKFVRGETGYDTYHPHCDRLYRITVASEILSSGGTSTGALSSPLWAPAMQKRFPEIENTTRMVFSFEPLLFEIGDNRINQDNVYYTESSVFDLFGWDLIAGDPQKVFDDPNGVVLTERSARKYFGEKHPVGRTITLVQQERNSEGKIEEKRVPLIVTGLMSDVPQKTHVKPEVLISFITLNGIFGGDINEGSHPNPDFWRYTIGYTYLLLRENMDPVELEKKFPQFITEHIGDANISRGFTYHLYLQNVSGIHIEKNVHSKPEPGTDQDHLTLFSVVAFFILLVACFNFINLSTARAGNRSLEVGIRKVVGSSRKDLINQFLTESIFLSLVALILALLLSQWVGSVFSNYTGKEIALPSGEISIFILSLIGIVLFVGGLAGCYPAFFLSAFQPCRVLKKTFQTGVKGAAIRKALVVLQFAITIFFIIGTLTIRKQLMYMRSQDLRFNSLKIFVIVPTSHSPLYRQMETFKNEQVRHPNIERVSLSTVVPGRMYGRDIWSEVGKSEQETTLLLEIESDYDFVDLYGLELIAGRTFLRELGTDGGRHFLNFMDMDLGRLQVERVDPETSSGPKEIAIILNEEAVRRLGLGTPEQALGRILVRDPVSVDFHGRVIGVVQDFHFESLRTEIQPLVLFMHDSTAQYPMCVSIKCSGRDLTGTIADINKLWNAHFPESTFESFFMDENFSRLYEQEERIFQVYGYVSLLSIVIACLGLFGLILYVVEQKTKEIGIRKVLGASIADIFVLFSKDYVKLVFIANLIAWPVSYHLMNRWLQDFAYRTSIGPWTFVFTPILTFVVSLGTIGFQVVKAARANPVEALKYE